MNPEAVVSDVRAAVLSSVEVFAQRGTGITGYSLCTDDNLNTLYHVAFSGPLFDSSSPWASPVEWKVSAKEVRPNFSKVSKVFSMHLDAAHSDEDVLNHVTVAFECLCRGLELARPQLESIRQGSELLLLVVSTDPSPFLQRLAVGAAERLNGCELFLKWKREMYPSL